MDEAPEVLLTGRALLWAGHRRGASCKAGCHTMGCVRCSAPLQAAPERFKHLYAMGSCVCLLTCAAGLLVARPLELHAAAAVDIQAAPSLDLEEGDLPRADSGEQEAATQSAQQLNLMHILRTSRHPGVMSLLFIKVSCPMNGPALTRRCQARCTALPACQLHMRDFCEQAASTSAHACNGMLHAACLGTTCSLADRCVSVMLHKQRTCLGVASAAERTRRQWPRAIELADCCWCDRSALLLDWGFSRQPCRCCWISTTIWIPRQVRSDANLL